MVSVLPGPMDEPTFFPGTNGGPSERTREIVDEEVKKIVDECYEAALERLREHRERLESLARELLARETLDEDDAYRAAGFDRKPPAAEQGDDPELDRVAATTRTLDDGGGPGR
jgi:cell division protease FtsH